MVVLTTVVFYIRQLRIKLAIIIGLTHTLAIPSEFGQSQICRNCGYTFLWVALLYNFKLIS